MAGKVRHLVNRKGRYHARLVVPKRLRPIVGRTELRTPLGGDYRQALKSLPGAVAELQHRIAEAEHKTRTVRSNGAPRYPLATDQIAYSHYMQRLEFDNELRNDPRYASVGIRITPDAGSVKAGNYRDVPLHPQVIELGFIEFVMAASSGPLFHAGKSPAKYTTAASSVSDEVAKWLRRSNLTPSGVWPNHAWRHRFKTVAREIGASDRVADAICGHAGRTAGDDYGDVSLKAKCRLVEAIPKFPLG